MSTLAEEAASIVDRLPPDKAQALIEYARYLGEKVDAEQWERRFSDPRYAVKLNEMAEGALAEFRAGQTQPLEPETL